MSEEDTATKCEVKVSHHIGEEDHSLMEFESPAKRPQRHFMSESKKKTYDKENMMPEHHFSLKDVSLASSASFISEDIRRVTMKSISP